MWLGLQCFMKPCAAIALLFRRFPPELRDLQYLRDLLYATQRVPQAQSASPQN